MTNKTKQCSKCGEEKPATVEYFYKKGNGFLGKCKVCFKTYYEANKEVIIERQTTYYEANKEAILEQLKVYRKVNKEAIAKRDKARYRTPKGKFNGIKKKAKERNINFSLPFELYESQLWGKPCHYCEGDIEITGLDRKDNNRGYVPDNVVPCCYDCNTKKGTKPYQDFIAEVKNER